MLSQSAVGAWDGSLLNNHIEAFLAERLGKAEVKDKKKGP